MKPLLRRWAGILSAYFTAQTLTQVAGMAAGLVLVNILPVREFALYTLALSLVNFVTFASDLGSSTSLVFFSHDAARRGEPFQPYFDAVLSLRRWAFAAGALATLVVLPRSAMAKGFGFAESLCAALAVLVAVWFQIAASLRVLALRLALRYGAAYRAELSGGGTRLLLALLLGALSLLKAWAAVGSNALGAAATAILARRSQGSEGAEGAQGAEPVEGAQVEAPAAASGELPAAASAPVSTIPVALGPYRRRVLRYLLPSLPSALYFSVQGPLVVWLAATFGGTRNLAEVGALGRLGLAMSIFSGLSGVVFLPRLARIVDDRLYRIRYLQFGALIAGLAAAMVAAAALLPRAFLFLLGSRYAGLERELLLVVTGAGINQIGGYAVAVNLARSWNRLEGAAVAVLILAQASLVALLPLGTTAGVLRFNVWTAIVGLSLQLLIAWAGFTRPRWVRWM